MAEEIRVVQISDLHFSSGRDPSRGQIHSTDHLLGLEAALSAKPFDRLIVSGDVTDNGDKESLLNARQYLLGRIELGGGRKTGLGLEADKSRLRVIPGNHDAFNNLTDGGPWIDRWQKGIANFKDVFGDLRDVVSEPDYDWLDLEDGGVFIAYVNSAYCGDPTIETHLPKNYRRDLLIARGRLTAQTSQRLLEWHEQGVAGVLEVPERPGDRIQRERFQRSLKMIVMHHYVFEPPELRDATKVFMRLDARKVIYRNLVMADFDILLCGHKHVASVDRHEYGKLFDQRARVRYLFNGLRRYLGLSAVPEQLVDSEGLRVSRWWSLLATWFYAATRRRGVAPDAAVQDVLSSLRRALEAPKTFEAVVRDTLARNAMFGSEGDLDASGLQQLGSKLRTHLKASDTRQANLLGQQLTRVLDVLASRAFVQVMCGSTTKAWHIDTPEDGRKARAFQTLAIRREDQRYRVRIERFPWNALSAEFSETPFVDVLEFDDGRRGVLARLPGRA